jgi:dihydrofolate synthase/folylpolyglutamate synthase
VSREPEAGSLGWSYEQAEAYLSSLEPIGWRFGLDRIRRLVGALGMPQHRFASVHVVGTNGKSSVARMTAALLEAHGVSAGAYLSPHLMRWSERVLVRGEEIEGDRFGAAVERVAESAAAVNRTLDEGDAVTQFEVATAAAFVALAAAGVEVGVIEAGLGGRLDATNVLPSRVCALTSVGLEHTEWLGDTFEQIAAEKLAVLRDRSTLICGELDPAVAALAGRTARERHARIVTARPSPTLQLRARGPYQRRNFAVALAAAEATLGGLDHAAATGVAEALQVPGRMEVTGSDPPLILDAAHNPDGARALAEALPEVAGAAPVVACIAVLTDKDAEGMVAALAPGLAHAVCTEVPAQRLASSGRPGTSTLPAARLVELCGRAGLAADPVTDPEYAVERALDEARSRGGIALCTGSHYLLGYARTAGPGSRS